MSTDRAKLAVAASAALSDAIEGLGEPEIAAHAVVLVVDARGQMSCATTLASLEALAETLRRAAADTGRADELLSHGEN